MEALSGVASGFAVASLSIQLVESVGKIITFIRNVKNAPSEFIRLVELLKRLHALLEDVRDVLERQSSLQGQHFPMPSMTIIRCLEGCENSLKPLQDIIGRHERTQAQRNSSMALMKGNIKFGLKVKDIAGFETRIQQDIQYLTGALVLNNTSIAMRTPVTLNTHTHTSILTNAPVCDDQLTLGSKSTCHNETQDTNVSTVRYFQRMTWIPSRFERFGIHQQRLVKNVHLDEERTGKITNRRIEPCVEEYIGFWAPRFLGHGISWNKRYPCGQIIPSLTVYPVIDEFITGLPFDMRRVSILELQKMFTTNIIHPFARNSKGESLLHLAAQHERGDVCRLLSRYGVRSDLSLNNWSPLRIALYFSGLSVIGRSDAVDALRILFHESDLIDDFGEPIWTELEYPFGSWAREEAEWMWTESSNIFHGEDLLKFQSFLFRNAICRCSHLLPMGHHMKFLSRLSITPELRHQIETGDAKLLTNLFGVFDDASESYTRGSAFITLLVQLNIDFKLCILNELYKLPGRILRIPYCWDRKISFDYNEEKEWILGWDFEFNSESPIFHVISEFSALVKGYNEWPLHETNWTNAHDVARYNRTYANRVSRFRRRTANKARKERARTGQKRPRSKMPGAWA